MFARLLPIALALVLVTGCEKATHDNIDKWGHTQKGPDKQNRQQPCTSGKIHSTSKSRGGFNAKQEEEEISLWPPDAT